ncbi:MAG: translocation/assembly module TamB domain-containing protein [Ignavibacteriaceae bacterium]
MKELDLVAAILDFEDFSVDGNIEGELKKNGNQTAFTTNLKFDFLKNKINGESVFLTDAKLEFALSHPTNYFEFDKLKLNTDLSIRRVFYGTEVKDIALLLSLDSSLIRTTASADVTGDLRVETAASVNLKTSNPAASFQNLSIVYKELNLRNKRDFTIDYTNKKIKINDFNLYRGEGEFVIDGLVDPNGEQDLRIKISKFRGYDIGFSVLNMSPENIIDYDVNLDATVKGTFASPLLDLNVGVKDLTFQEKHFGSLSAKFEYRDMTMLADIAFANDKDSSIALPLQIKGSVPINLSLTSVEERLPKDKNVNLVLLAKEFNLASFGDALPFVNNLQGVLTSDIVISGPYDNLKRSGNLSIRNASFLAEANNLNYGAGLTLRLDDETVFIDSILVENIGNVPYKGVMKGSGRIDFRGLDMVKTQFLIGGNLQVLSYDSKNASPAVYGDLFIGTDSDVIFAMTPDRTFLQAHIKINNADLFFPPLQSSYSGSSSNFIYKYAESGKTLSEREAEIQRIVAESRARTEEIFIEAGTTSNFDYDIRVRINDEARISFVLAEQANQKLIANLKGDLTYKSMGGIQNIQGELTLLEGSTLEFLKTFTATGSIKFESDLTNPYLNITATYKNYRMSSESGSEGKETEVAVKIKLRGTVKDLSSNFMGMEDNIAVYEGAENIQNDKPSADKEKADAIWFILTGKFTNETTSQEKQQSAGMIEGTATSLAGSLLGGVLNTYLGDYVRTLDVRSSGIQTKFSLTGTVKGLRYTIGGSTNFLQDLSNANIRIEYPIFESLFLRVERRESLTETNYPSEMINEMGLKYRFEF